MPSEWQDPRLRALAQADPTETPLAWRDLLEGRRTGRKVYTSSMGTIMVVGAISMVVAALIVGGSQVAGLLVGPAMAIMAGHVILNGWPKRPGSAPTRPVVVEAGPATEFTRRLATVALSRMMWLLPVAVLITFVPLVLLSGQGSLTPDRVAWLCFGVLAAGSGTLWVLTSRDRRARTVLLTPVGITGGKKQLIAWSQLARVDLTAEQVRGSGRARTIKEATLTLVPMGRQPFTVRCEDFDQHPIALLAALRFYWTNPQHRAELGTPVADHRIEGWAQRARQTVPL